MRNKKISTVKAELNAEVGEVIHKALNDRVGSGEKKYAIAAGILMMLSLSDSEWREKIDTTERAILGKRGAGATPAQLVAEAKRLSAEAEERDRQRQSKPPRGRTMKPEDKE